MSEKITKPSPLDDSKANFGFWLYLMTDCVLFAALFATFAVLQANTAGGPPGRELFSLPFVLAGTLILLTSSFTCGLALLAVKTRNTQLVYKLFGITALLGLAFLGLELFEFRKLVEEGNDWQRSAFLSSFFTLVGTHGLHITAGLIWLAALLVQLKTRGFTRPTIRRFGLFAMFWHFLDIIWILIFTIVYLKGAI